MKKEEQRGDEETERHEKSICPPAVDKVMDVSNLVIVEVGQLR